MTHQEPSPGDFVTCTFKDDPTKKRRPALVIDIKGGFNGKIVRVVYGSTQKVCPSGCICGEFTVTPADGSSFVWSGLKEATRFDTNHSQWIPIEAVKVIGTLHTGLQTRARKALSESQR